MLKLSNKLYAAQINWIRKHPVQFVALNATLLGLLIGFVQIQERKFNRELEEARTQHDL